MKSGLDYFVYFKVTYNMISRTLPQNDIKAKIVHKSIATKYKSLIVLKMFYII